MNVPGSNLLATALQVITPQAVSYARYTGTTTNAAGLDTATYAAAVDLYGSFQPMDVAAVVYRGLDMAKKYALFYASQRFLAPGRDGAGDVMTFDSRVWQVMDAKSWYAVDGWDVVLLVEVGPSA